MGKLISSATPTIINVPIKACSNPPEVTGSLTEAIVISLANIPKLRPGYPLITTVPTILMMGTSVNRIASKAKLLNNESFAAARSRERNC